jgi:hypothetical protein
MKKQNLGKLVIDLGYVVDLNDEKMIELGKDCLYEDLMALVKNNEIYDAIRLINSPESNPSDIPEFILTETTEENSYITDVCHGKEI